MVLGVRVSESVRRKLVLLRYSIYVCPLSSTRGAVGSGGSVARRVEKQEGGEKCRFSWAYRDL